MIGIRFHGVSSVIKVGETFTMRGPVYRKWWQFWKPKIVGYELQKFVVIEDVVKGALPQ